MKKVLKVTGIVLLVIIIFLGCMFFYIKSRPEPVVDIAGIDLNAVRDGSYTGEYESVPVKVVVKVDIADHKITAIEILEHQNGLGKPAEKIAEDIIAKQSLNVDVISGATRSSNVIRKAVENALKKGTGL